MMPRKDEEINPKELEARQQQTATGATYFDEPVTPNALKKIIKKTSR